MRVNDVDRQRLRLEARVSALFVQNGNAYAEGLTELRDPIKAYWREATPAHREKLRGFLTPDGIRGQYLMGVPTALHARYSPDSWTLDSSRIERPGNVDVQPSRSIRVSRNFCGHESRLR